METQTIGMAHLGLRDQVVAELRSRIVDGFYPPGQRLTEDRLAADFGVSRNPVREALRVIEADGLVTITPRRGAVVATPDLEAVADLFAVRSSLEPLAARLAAERATAQDVVDLRSLLADARRATDAGDFSQVADLNSSLHMRVIDIGGNRWLRTISASIYLHVHWIFRIGASFRAAHSWEEHVRLVDAIAEGDPVGAEMAALHHVDAAAEAALANLPRAI